MLRQDPAKRVPAAAGSKWLNDLGQRPGLGERCARLRGQRQTGTSGHETSAIHACPPRQMILPTTSDWRRDWKAMSAGADASLCLAGRSARAVDRVGVALGLQERTGAVAVLA